MSRIRQLAMNWEDRARFDASEASRYESIRDAMTASATTRRNCAWELRRVLDEMEKENPLEGGCLRASQPDSELG